jgi:hypothetical protein
MSDKLQHSVELRTIGDELFVVVERTRVERHAGEWITTEPGWSVIELKGGNRLQLSYHGAKIH